MSSYEDFNYNSIMEVLGHTVDTETGIEIPGEFMPSGNPVVASGIRKGQLVTGDSAKSLLEQWFGAVRGAYERELDEKNHESSTADAQDLVIRGEDDNPRVDRGSARAETDAPESFEEELRRRLKGASAEAEEAKGRLQIAERQIKAIEAALSAITDEQPPSS